MPQLPQIVSLLTCAVATVSTAMAAEPAVFEDAFAGGEAELAWKPHPLAGDTAVEGRAVGSAPDGDGGIGVLRHRGGAMPTVSYADTAKAEDSFALEAEVHCPLDAGGRDGTLTGLAFYVLGAAGGEETEAGGFYRFVCDYRLGDASFSLAYLGANAGRQPLELESWPLLAGTAAGDAGDPWRDVRIAVDRGLMTFHVDGSQLNERPLPAERVITDIANVDAGYAGVYASHIGVEGDAEARIDGFVYEVR